MCEVALDFSFSPVVEPFGRRVYEECNKIHSVLNLTNIFLNKTKLFNFHEKIVALGEKMLKSANL